MTLVGSGQTPKTEV